MWLNTGILVLLIAVCVNALSTCSPKSCKTGFDATKPACGSDGLTYPNRCQLEMARCHNANITFVNRGICAHQKSCEEYARNHPAYAFVPQCRPDGTYAPFQCSIQVGFCWCVTPNGMPISTTLKRHKPGIMQKARCGRGVRKITRSSHKNRRRARSCTYDDKALFNRNLLHIFTSDWHRDHPMVRDNLVNDSVVLEWKFHKMDLDHNEKLDKNEYKDLKRLVKQIVKPKRCAKSFAKACDMNRDQVIGKLEWAQCLTRDGVDDGVGGRSDDESQDGEDDENYSYPDTGSPFEGGGNNVVNTVLPDILVDNAPPYNTRPNLEQDSADHIKDEDVTDCKTDRKVALDEKAHYIPECTVDGRYAKVQCYKSAGYCWCVNEDTGANIPGTSLKDKIPTCDLPFVSRPMKGCPEEKKNIFLRDMMEYLHANMVRETNGTLIPGSKEERIASWSFIFYDKNKNQFLDKAEWKAFKDAMSAVKKLRRCGKKLPRYCDINKDRVISVTEWRNCLNARHTETITSDERNPLSVLLED